MVEATETNLIYSEITKEGKIVAYEVTGYEDTAPTELVIPDSHNGLPVISIGRVAFDNCTSLTSILIPNSVVSIMDYAFGGCTGLTSITIPDSVTSIGDSAFRGCTSFTAVHITDLATWCRITFGNPTANPLYYARHLYLNDEEITNLVIPDSVTSIREYAFYGCLGLTSMTIPNSVTEIRDHAFEECYKLVEVYNLSSLAITEGSFDYGYAGYYAKDVHTSLNEESILHTMDDYVFCVVGEEVWLVGYTGSDTSLTLPKNYYDKAYDIYQYAFLEHSDLTSIAIPDSVTSIGEYAFLGCTGLIEVTLPDSVESIGVGAFADCTSLPFITIPDRVMIIEDSTFSSCTGLTEVTIGISVTSIGGYAFDGCEGLTSIALPDSVTSIGKNAFYGCTGLNSITIPGSVTSIGSYAFENCTGLTSITIGNSVTSVETGAFFNCTGLTAVYITDLAAWCGIAFNTFESNPLYYAYHLYLNDEEITNLVIPGSVTRIENYAFYGCKSLVSITIPNSVSSVGVYAFSNCAGLTSITIPDSVTSIGSGAFKSCSSLKSIVLPFVGSAKDGTGATNFGHIFGGANSTVPTSLTTVTITGGTIADRAFYGCSGLTSITLERSVISIGSRSFANCTSLASIAIPNDLTKIGGYAFENCAALTSINIPSNIKSISTGMFTGCASLNSIEIPDKVENIEKYAFRYCGDLASIVIPDSVKSIGIGAFETCTSLEKVKIGSSVTQIEATAFYNCAGLTSIVIPGKVTSIGERVFDRCAKLESITLPFVGASKNGTTNTSFGYIFGGANSSVPASLKTVTITGGGIPANAFEACVNIAGIILENGVTRIGNAAFMGCTGLKGIVIQGRITSIGNDAFNGCTGLEGTCITDLTAWCGATFGNQFSNPLYFAHRLYVGGEEITELTIPDDVTSIRNYAFNGCTELTKVTIGTSVANIGEYAFSGCHGLTSATIPNSVTSIGYGAFQGCTGLAEITIPFVGGSAGATSASSSTLFGYIFGTTFYTGGTATEQHYSSSSYTTYYIPTSLQKVTVTGGQLLYGAFSGCKRLTSITLENGVTSIGNAAFSGCGGLKEITIPFVGAKAGITANDTYQYPFGYIFGTTYYEGSNETKQHYYGPSTSSPTSSTYYIPTALKKVTVIGGNILYGAFSNCSGLETIITRNTVESIGKNAFLGCDGVNTLVISKNATNISEETFGDIPRNSNIYYGGSEKEWLYASSAHGILKTKENKIEHFDLVLYPFKTVYGLNNKTEYKNSFKYTAENLEKIRADLALNKTIAHNIVQPVVGQDDEDIACIKNYLKLKARVTTTKKVTHIEEAEILNNIYTAVYTNFNARQVDFGEEIPYETLVSVIKNADYRIKEVNLDEPMLSTKFSLLGGGEETLSDAEHTENLGNMLYNKLVRRNVLAGKISAFKYDEDFISEYDKTSYNGYAPVYPESSDTSKKITKIESQFDVGTAFSNRPATETDGYVLKENEVIQFRVPNFKTTKTYPAYVNYFIKLNSTEGSKDAIPATFMSLGVYMASKPDSTQPVRWETFVNLSDIKPKLEIIPKSTKESEEEAETENKAKFDAEKKTKAVLFSYDTTNSKYVVADKYISGTTYYYLPINDDIFAKFNSWIKNQDSKQPTIDFDPEHPTYKKLEGIYREVGVQEKPFGRLIDVDLRKYLPAYKFGAVSSNETVLAKFYVQETRAEDDPAIGTADGLGRDASYVGVPKDGEYQLKTGEYLLINYTDSKTDEAGVERKTVINKVYSEGDVIRANFELIDSALYHNSHSYSKKDGFSFEGQTPEGMFTLGTNEQIEIRDIVQVDLDGGETYLYWTLNSDDPNALSNSFIFNENYGNGTNNAYTLKEGEHLYYTDSKKQDLVYYGAGTLVVKSTPSLELRKYTSNGEVSEEDIMTHGLAANIPWQPFSFDGAKKLTIIENQYISLTEGDIIIKIDGSDPISAETMPNGSWNNWKQVSKPVDTEYRLAEDDVNSHLPPLVVSGINWTVRSRLDFNMSKTTAQPLHRGDSLKITFADESTQPLEPTETVKFAPVYVNSNYTCQAAIDTLDATKLLESGLELKLKISSKSTPTISDREDLTLNNYINGEAKYTKFDFENLPADHGDGPAFSLNISIPKNDFGLIAIYYIKDADETTVNGAYTKAKAGDVEISGIEFFNTGDFTGTTKTLKAGLNIIKLSPDVKQLEVYADVAKKSTVIFGNLDIVAGINPKLDYRLTDDQHAEGAATTKLDQLLKDIKASGVAEDFYYNVPIQRANEIDLNTAVTEDTLSNPLAWYDPNNINRKFVISEIDADYLATGITLTKTSRV